jgi:hypothetical protein
MRNVETSVVGGFEISDFTMQKSSSMIMGAKFVVGTIDNAEKSIFMC